MQKFFVVECKYEAGELYDIRKFDVVNHVSCVCQHDGTKLCRK